MTRQQSRGTRTAGAAAAVLITGLVGAAATSASAAGEPEQDLTVGVPVASIADLNPFGPNVLVQGNMQVNEQLFDTLVEYSDGEFVPSLATEWTSNEDATRWSFTLRDDVVFSDGSALDAADVIASVAQTVELAGPTASLFADLTVEAGSPNEVTISSDTGRGSLLGTLSMLSIGPSEAVANDDFGVSPVGSGPFTVGSFDPSTGVEMIANEDYWGGRPQLDRLTFRPISEQAAMIIALENGDIDVTWTVPNDQVDGLQGNDDLVVDSVPTLANLLLWFNSSREPFTDPAVRRALWQATDVAAIVEALYDHTGQLMSGPLPDGVLGASEQAPYEYDPDAARAALEEAGFDFDHEIGILMTNSNYLPFVEAMVAQWSEIGVRAAPDVQEPSVGTPLLLDLDWDMAAIQPVITSTGDADYNLGRLYPCRAERNGYCNEELDALLADAASTGDQAARAELYAEAGAIVWDDAVGMFPMNVVQVWAWRVDVEGIVLDPIYQPDFTQVHRV